VLRARDICCSVAISSVGDCHLPVLTSHACPYPELAEQDRGICAAERLMIQDLVGSTVKLAECRLDGGSICSFVAGERSPAKPSSQESLGTCTSDG
jgi:predicted ArsR family transcriptional regulator